MSLRWGGAVAMACALYILWTAARVLLDADSGVETGAGALMAAMGLTFLAIGGFAVWTSLRRPKR